MANDKMERDDQVSDRLEWRTEGGRYRLPLPTARLDWPTLRHRRCRSRRRR